MRNLFITSLFAVVIAMPALAAERHQSYFTFDDGGTVVRAADDGSEVTARVNLPLFAGDEVRTSRRGRSEVRLADGNVVAIDRSTSIRVGSVLNDYDSEDGRQTVTELLAGQVLVSIAEGNSRTFRLDTRHATLVPSSETIFTVDAYSSNVHEVSVHDGAVEVRTPEGTTRLRAGESAKVDGRGLIDTYELVSRGIGDFERWALGRAGRYGRRSSRYLDRSISYADYDLDNHGSWIYVSDYGGYAWRPRVGAGWRPYHYGSWTRSRRGSLVWVSDEPWGWAPYHYGRWAHNAGYGWVWLPGSSYAPAWVYWAFAPSYVGWVPAGWYDCYPAYYNWAYRPYSRGGYYGGFGFGHVRLGGVDLRPWTFVSPGVLVSNRIDRAALTTDAIRNRLSRDGDRVAISGSPVRFSKNDLKDPVTAVSRIARRGIGSGTGKEGSGTSSDMTPFFRRDPELSTSLRNRVARGARSVDPVATAGTPTTSPVDRNSLAPLVRPGVAAPSSSGIIRRGSGRDTSEGDPTRISRETTPEPKGSIETPTSAERHSEWRGRISRGGSVREETPASPSVGGSEADRRSPVVGGADSDKPAGSEGSWRGSGGRIRRGDAPVMPSRGAGDETSGSTEGWRRRGALKRGTDAPPATPGDTPAPAVLEKDRRETERAWRKNVDVSPSDVPRRIIDQIGGGRVRASGGRDESPSGTSESGGRIRRDAPAPERTQRADPPPPPPAQAAPQRESRPQGAEKSTNIKRDKQD
ncbi:MAG TPA: FecR family protein [Thermoanaerobaculia bacterium]|nr:FecR family protein [Thermoanaerobaculia bacterium]